MIRNLPTAGTIRKLLSYDEATGLLYWRKRDESLFKTKRSCNAWNTRNATKRAFTSKSDTGYHQGSIFDKNMLAHRVIWCLKTGGWPENDIDHINGDRTDNRWNNLRSVTRSENCKNAARPNNNKSGRTGTHFYKRVGKWVAYIRINGSQHHLGYFETQDQAVRARIEAEQKFSFMQNDRR